MAIDTLELQLVEPRLQRFLAEAPVAPELDVRDAAGPRLGPDPVLSHAQAIGHVADGQEAGHSSSSRHGAAPGNRSRREGLAARLVPNRPKDPKPHSKSPAMQGLSRIAGAGFEPATFGL
jgi:hypothetical protein